MEQLLNIRPADNLRDCIKELTRKIESKSITPDANLDLAKSEHRHDELLIEQQNLKVRLEAAGFDIETVESELRETKQKIRLFSGQGAIENNAKLETAKHSELRNQEEALTSLSEAFERDAFLRLNAKQVQKTMPVVDRCAHGQCGVSGELLESLREPLKEVFTTPPYLNNQRLPDPQISFYQKKIAKLLDSRDIDEEDDSPFKLDSWRAKNWQMYYSFTHLSIIQSHHCVIPYHALYALNGRLKTSTKPCKKSAYFPMKVNCNWHSYKISRNSNKPHWINA